jgi:UDP-galactopyranose mutase
VQQYDYLIVGCGFFGSVFAQQARENGKSVLMMDRRPHLGGNCNSYKYEDTGIYIHKYGSHIFHCSDDVTWKYINRFTAFNRHLHRVLTTHQGKVYSMPINLGTINSFFGTNLRPNEVASFLDKQRTSGSRPANLEEQAISLIGKPLYEAFIRGYTRKQWGCDPRDLPITIIARLPVRQSYHDAYFNDRYQGIPLEGYTPIFERMLKGVDIELSVDYFSDREIWEKKATKVIYTGPIDRYFDYCYGRLNWRSVRFEMERIDCSDYQGISVMNYADEDAPWTRIHEPKHFHLERPWNKETTIIIKEFPCIDPDQPYYPVNFAEDREMYAKYSALQSERPNVIFGGRLALYKYYDMNQVIAGALAVVRNELTGLD